MCLKHYFSIIFYLFICVSYSQNNSPFVKYKVNKHVYTITEDNLGFIWALTDKGLFKFNGSEFDYISTENGMNDDFIHMLIDKDHDPYFINYFGQIVKVCSNNTGNKFLLSIKNTITINYKSAITYKDDLFFRGYTSDRKNYEVKVNRNTTTLKELNNDAYKLVGIFNDTSYFFSEKNKSIYKTENYLYVGEINTNQITNDIVRFCIPDIQLVDSLLYYIDGNKIMTFNVSNGHTKKIVELDGLSEQRFNRFSMDKFSNLWVLTNTSAYVFQRNGANVYHFDKGDVVGAFEGFDHLYYWLCLSNGDLYKIIKPSIQVPIVFTKKHGYKAIIDDTSNLNVFNNKLYLTTRDKSVFISNLVNYYKSYTGDVKVTDISFYKNTILVFLNSGIFVSSKHPFQLNNKFSIRETSPSSYDFHTSIQGSYSFKEVVKKNDSVYYAAVGFKGVSEVLVENNGRNVTVKQVNISVKTPVSNVSISQDNLIYSSDKTLYFYSLSERITKKKISLKHRISSFVIFNDTLVVGFANKGIGVIINGKITYYNVSNSGICSNFVNKLVINGNKIWLATDDGLQCFYFDKIPVFYQPNLGVNFCRIDNIISLPNQLCLLSNLDSSLIQCNLSDITFTSNERPPHLYVKQFGGNFFRKTEAKLVLPYKDNFIYFDLSTINFTDRKIHYYYNLKKDREVLATYKYLNQTKLILSSLSAGDYLITFIAKNNNGLLSNKITYRFTVETPFWDTLLFKILLILTVSIFTGILFFLFYSYRLRKQKTKYESEYKILELEQQLFKSLMNPHFVFNSMSSIQSLINENRAQEANNHIALFSSLIRKNLHDSMDSFCSLEDELEKLRLYIEIENLRFNNAITYNITIDSYISMSQVLVPGFILQPIVENSIQHGLMPRKGGHVDVKFVLKSKTKAEIVITDDGIGLVESTNRRQKYGKKSISMGLIRKRFSHLQKIYEQPFSVELFNREAIDGVSGVMCRIEFCPVINSPDSIKN